MRCIANARVDSAQVRSYRSVAFEPSQYSDAPYCPGIRIPDSYRRVNVHSFRKRCGRCNGTKGPRRRPPIMRRSEIPQQPQINVTAPAQSSRRRRRACSTCAKAVYSANLGGS